MGMGVLYSSIDKEGYDPPEGKAQAAQSARQSQRRLHKMPQVGRLGTRSRRNLRTASRDGEFDSGSAYNKALEALQLKERERAFDAAITIRSSNVEKDAAALLRKIKLWDLDHTYGQSRDSHGYPTGKRTQGEHFLGVVDLINKTELFKVAKRMPKGAHLHIH